MKNPVVYLNTLESDNYRFLTTFKPGHFYSPIPDYGDVFDKGVSRIDRSITEIPGIDLNTKYQMSLAEEFAKYHDELPFPNTEASGARFWLDNGLYSYGDAVVLYSMMRHFNTKNIIEIGSGYSSAAMLDVNDSFFYGAIDFIFVEPYPDRLNALLSDKDKNRCQIYEKKIQDVPLSIFTALSENDLLFVDSSHVVKTGSDLLYILSEVVPRLNKGVLLHFHDIFWPFEYPDEWYQDGRAWNEAFFLKAFLQFNDSYEIVFYNAYMKAHYAALLEEKLPLMMKRPAHYPYTQGNSSLWLRKIK